jgi:hypothetical protein
MVAIATPVPQATSLHPLVAQAAALGYPATLFGCTPEQHEYWVEPGLPLLTPELRKDFPLGYNGLPALPMLAHLQGNDMGPRFPDGCGVVIVAVYELKNLVLGRVYTYSFRNLETGYREMAIGRLTKIGGNYLEVKADNHPTPSRWLLREEPGQAVWDVHEVTHYASDSGKDE